ncbi:MAG: hypothetical protein VYC20_06555 [Pseudomonadota bacterium]|nr:hypothetical protein [Pseudomonadota bacterium]
MRQAGATKQVIDRLFDMPPVTDQKGSGESARRPIHAGGDFVRAALAERGKTHPPVKVIRRQRGLGREEQPQDLPFDHAVPAMDPVDLQPDA